MLYHRLEERCISAARERSARTVFLVALGALACTQLLSCTPLKRRWTATDAGQERAPDRVARDAAVDAAGETVDAAATDAATVDRSTTNAEDASSAGHSTTDAGCERDAASCNAPPASGCADEATLRVYATVGLCSDGNCAYSYVDLPCTGCPLCEDECFIDTDGDTLPEPYPPGAAHAQDRCLVCDPTRDRVSWSARTCSRSENPCVQPAGTCDPQRGSASCNDDDCCEHEPVFQGEGTRPRCPLPLEDDGDRLEQPGEQWSGLCDGTGACAACAENTDCANGWCVCANADCTSQRCSSSPCPCSFDSDGDGSCDGHVSDGASDRGRSCEDGVCNGLGSCRQPLGEACSEDVECGSDRCVDGVCCATACTGNCERCDSPTALGQCIADSTLCEGSCVECVDVAGRFECRADSDRCVGNCDVCVGSGNAFNCLAEPALCTGNCDSCVGGGNGFSCAADATLCTGNCDSCSGSGTAFSCTANAALCTGNCDTCSGSGNAFNCGPNAALCAGNCSECVGAGTSYSCGAQPAACDACQQCAGGGLAFSCEQELIADVVQEQADDFTLIAPWQSFTVTTSGRLWAIELRPNAFGGIAGALSVHEGQGTTGPLLHTQSYAIASVSGSPWQRFQLTQPVPVTAGDVFTWELSGANGIHHSLADVYAGGRSSSAGRDMVMRIYVTPCP